MRKVLISFDGLGRIAIVERSDGLFTLYSWWYLPPEAQPLWNISPVVARTWRDEGIDLGSLYDNFTKPISGLFDSLELAEAEARSRPGFASALEHKPSGS